MSRLPRFCPAGLPQHIIQRGNNRSICFASDKDFAAYAHWLHEYSVTFNVDIHAWVFRPIMSICWQRFDDASVGT
jgi:putative transposase